MQNQKINIYKGVFVLLLFAHAFTVNGQQTGDLTPGSLKVNGLENEEVLLKIFVGNFSDIKFQSDDFRNSIVFMSYVQAYSRKCRNHLPSNSIELTEQVCVRENVTRNGFGHEINRYCIEYETRPTGTYVSPKMHQSMQQLGVKTSEQFLSNLINSRESLDKSMANLMDSFDMVQFQSKIQRDINYLVQQHSCKSPELMHFQENLRRYALGLEPVRLEYDKSLFAGPPPPSLPERQNYDKLVDDLVYNESKGWAVNQFIDDSISDVKITSTDRNGYPRVMKANYRFKSFGNKEYRGSVTITFDSGIPECLYFSDFPDRCREPYERIISAYSGGDYSKDKTEDTTREIEPYVVAEQMPELIGGLEGLQAKVRYPDQARLQGVQGRVYVQFIVDEKGNVINPQIIRGVGAGTSEEALRVIKLVKFKPGLMKGKPVPVQYSLPIYFKPD
jgi:TonB family protein